MNDQTKTQEQLIEELGKLRRRSDARERVSSHLADAHETADVLDLIVNESARLLGANAAYMRLLERDGLVASAATESATAFLAELAEARPTNLVEAGESLTGHVMATKKPMVIEDGANQDLVSQDTSHIREKYEMHGTAAVPMLVNDRSIGVLVVVDTRIRLFTDDEVSLLAAFADQASCALEKARLLNETEKEKERSDALYQVSNKLAGVHDTDEVLDLIANEAARLLGANSAMIQLLEGDVLVPVAATQSAASMSADLSEADLSGADLRGVDFTEADLSSANLSGSNFRGAKLVRTNLNSANLSGANLREAALMGANLLDARLTNLISIEDADFTHSQGLSGEDREYLLSITAGAHPETSVATTESLN